MFDAEKESKDVYGLWVTSVKLNRLNRRYPSVPWLWQIKHTFELILQKNCSSFSVGKSFERTRGWAVQRGRFRGLCFFALPFWWFYWGQQRVRLECALFWRCRFGFKDICFDCFCSTQVRGVCVTRLGRCKNWQGVLKSRLLQTSLTLYVHVFNWSFYAHVFKSR